MIRIAIVGEIGSGKTYIANKFNYPIFDADKIFTKIYEKDRNCFNKIKKVTKNSYLTFPIKKKDLVKCILDNRNNLKKISNIVHPIVRKKLRNFLNKNRFKKIVVLDIPLFLENKLNKKRDIIIFIQAKKKDIKKRLISRNGYNSKIIKELKKIQLPLSFKKKKSNFIIKNDFKSKTFKSEIVYILRNLKK